MNNQNQVEVRVWLSKLGRQHFARLRVRAAAHLLLVGTGVLGLLVASCSDDKDRRQSSELRTEQTDASSTAENTSPAAADNSDASTTALPTGVGSRYRVIAERTYFFDAPQQSKPNGRYLLRGDVLFGEEETNGFVRTRFKNPNGATVTGWLKIEELGKLADSPVAGTRRSSPAARPAPAAPPTAEPDDYTYEPTQPSQAPAEPSTSGSSRTQTAVVQVPKSYFYNSPDLSQPRKAHCVQGDKVQLGESRGDAVYVTFTNWEKVTTTGWMRKDALRFTR